jgi:hypothetical protein
MLGGILARYVVARSTTISGPGENVAWVDLGTFRVDIGVGWMHGTRC